MKSRIFILLIVVFFISTEKSFAQSGISPDGLEKLSAVEDSLGLLAYAIINDSLEENRFGAVRAFIPMLVNALKTPNSFHYPFEQIKSVSIQYAADSTFRVFTWQLYVDKNTYRYYGAIQMNQTDLKLFPLIDRYEGMKDELEQASLKHDEWYGAVYYNIKSVTVNNQNYHLLFGFDGHSFFKKRKIVDVLSFKNDEPLFGQAVFITADTNDVVLSTKNRLLFEYSAAASVSCNYDEALELLIFDHLREIDGEYGEGKVNIPDGTYEAYELKKDLWYYKEKVFHQVLDEAPRPEPILEGRKRNILGEGN